LCDDALSQIAESNDENLVEHANALRLSAKCHGGHACPPRRTIRRT
jgi:hypothetical protein